MGVAVAPNETNVSPTGRKTALLLVVLVGPSSAWLLGHIFAYGVRLTR